MKNYSDRLGGFGKSACGWWFPTRELQYSRHLYRGTYVVSLGASANDDTDAQWVANFEAVVDDFGALRVVKHPWEAA